MSRLNNAHNNMYNSGWWNYPNHFWHENYQLDPQVRESNLEEVMANFIFATKSSFWNHGTSVQDFQSDFPPYEQKSELENAIDKFIATTEEKVSTNEARLQNQKISLKSLEMQIEQIVYKTSRQAQEILPRNMDKNLKEQVAAVTLKEGEEIQELELQENIVMGSPSNLDMDFNFMTNDMDNVVGQEEVLMKDVIEKCSMELLPLSNENPNMMAEVEGIEEPSTKKEEELQEELQQQEEGAPNLDLKISFSHLECAYLENNSCPVNFASLTDPKEAETQCSQENNKEEDMKEHSDISKGVDIFLSLDAYPCFQLNFNEVFVGEDLEAMLEKDTLEQCIKESYSLFEEDPSKGATVKEWEESPRQQKDEKKLLGDVLPKPKEGVG